MTFLSLRRLSCPGGRLQPKLTATRLYVVALLRDKGDRKENKLYRRSVIPLGSHWLSSQKSPFYDLCHSSIVKQETSFSS